MVTFRAASFGGLHVLVNNAAISQGYALDQIDGAYFERIYATNVTGTQLAATHAARWMTGQIIIARGGAV